MVQDEFDRQRLENTCIAISKLLREFLQQGKIDAQEFISIVAQMPVKLTDVDIDRWKV